jgi:hypothetical protein
MPSNVTDYYNANDNGNCINVLGSECIRPITNETGSTGNTMQTIFPSCRDTIGANGFFQSGGAAGCKSSSLLSQPALKLTYDLN